MRSRVFLDVIIDDEKWTENVDFDALKVAEELKEVAFEYVAAASETGECASEHELLGRDITFKVGVCLSNDEEVHKLNREFRGIDKPTNVLSFANIDEEEFWDGLVDGEESELGEIILAFETLEREAAFKNISLYAHYCHLLVHGFLHLLGFDHQDDADAEEMEGLETEILAAFSIDDPYREEAEVSQ